MATIAAKAKRNCNIRFKAVETTRATTIKIAGENTRQQLRNAIR